MSDQEEASSSASSTFTAITTSGNVVALRDIIVNQTTNVEAVKKIVTTFKLFDRPTRNFTGRKNLLEEIHEKMKKCSRNENCLDRIVVLSGLGGMGKSELARMYAHTYINHPIIQNIAWIDAEEREGMKASFKYLAKTLNIPTQNMELKEIIQEVYDYFSKHIKTGLFIFDNSKQMNDMPFGIYEYLPIQESIKHGPLLLLTARCNEWEIENENNVIHINELSQEESIELLEKKFQLAKDNENYDECKILVAELAVALQGYPLGLALATSNIKFDKTWTTLKTELDAYLARMEKPAGNWTGDKQSGAATNYKLIMRNVWETTLENIKDEGEEGKNAIRLLNIIAYFPSDNIEKERIEQIFQTCYSTSLSSKEFDVLEKYSLIKIEHRKFYGDKDEYFIRIHRLVQLTTRDKLDREKDVSYLEHLCKFFSYADYDENYSDETTMMGLHGFLKCQNWQRNSIQFSIVFCSMMAAEMRIDDALSLAKDIDTFLKSSRAKKAAIVNDEHFVSLFFLCKYRINEIKDFYEEQSEFDLNDKECENILILMIQPSTSFALTSKERPNSPEEHLYSLCLVLLLDLITSNVNLTSQLIPLINSTLKSTNCCSVKRISRIYKFMWKCLELNVPESLTLLEPVLNAHFQVYDRLGSEDEFRKYWDKPGYELLNYEFINKQLEDWDNREVSNRKMRGFKATNEFVETFVLAGGLRILCQQTVFITDHEKNDYHIYPRVLDDLLTAVCFLALYFNERNEFVKYAEFLSALFDLTKWIFKETRRCNAKTQENCAMVWFCIYSKQKPDKGIKDELIYTIAPLLERSLNELELGNNYGFFAKFCHFKNDAFDKEFVIQQFFNTVKDEAGWTAVKSAFSRNDKEYSESAVFALEINNLKVKLLMQSKNNAWRLLTILAYLKSATDEYEIKKTFTFIFDPDTFKNAFATLKKQSLLITCGDKYQEIHEFVRVKRCVRIWIRAELRNENNHHCLLGVINFVILHTIKHDDTNYWDFFYLHACLKDLGWPQNSTYFSMILSLFLTKPSLASNAHALSIVKDIYEFQEASQITNSNEPNWFGTELSQLFQLCSFWVDLNVKQINGRHRMWDDLNLDRRRLAHVFLTLIKPSIQHLLNPQINLTLVQNFLKKIPMYILRKLPQVAVNLATDLRQRIFLSILESFNASAGCVAENVREIFKLLWDYYQHACASDSDKFLGTIFSVNFHVCDSFASSPQAELGEYWEDYGPLNLRHVISACTNRSFAEKNSIADCFFKNRGPLIMIGFFNYMGEHTSRYYSNSEHVYRFIQMIAYELNLAHKFFEFPEFLYKFSRHRQQFHNYRHINIKFTLVSAWFSLFARQDARRNENECDFFLSKVASHLQEIIVLIEKEGLDDLYSVPTLLTEEILETFLETFSDESDSLAVNAAVRLQRLCKLKTDRNGAPKGED